MNSVAITVSCYENEVPSFVEARLALLYGSMFLSLLQFTTYGGNVGSARTYVARQGDVARYRSRSQFLLNVDTALAIAFKGYQRQLKRWRWRSHGAAHQHSVASRLAPRALAGMRALKRFTSGVRLESTTEPFRRTKQCRA
jgi:hypothetical protein